MTQDFRVICAFFTAFLDNFWGQKHVFSMRSELVDLLNAIEIPGKQNMRKHCDIGHIATFAKDLGEVMSCHVATFARNLETYDINICLDPDDIYAGPKRQ